MPHRHACCRIEGTKSESDTLTPVPPRACRVTVAEADGCRHTIDITAASLYEAAAIGLRTFRQYPWGAAALRAPGATIEVVVCGPSETHQVPVGRVERWLRTPPRSPKEKLLKDRLDPGGAARE